LASSPSRDDLKSLNLKRLFSAQAAKSETVKLAVDRLSEAPEAFSFRVERAWWDSHFPDLEASGTALVAEPAVEIRAWVVGEHVHLEGKLDGMLDAECGRCTRRYRHALRDSFELVLAPLSNADGPTDEEGRQALERSGMCLGEDLESGWYRGSEIELDALLTEVISLEIPMQPICREECPGLCPICGIDQSEKNCTCEDMKPTSPFAALAVLKEKGEGSS
jgi:uncharacterized protein